MKIWINKLGSFAVVFVILLIPLSITSCSDLWSEFDPHEWRYQPYPSTDMPPSWESDMGRPGPEYSGEDMFEDSW